MFFHPTPHDCRHSLVGSSNVVFLQRPVTSCGVRINTGIALTLSSMSLSLSHCNRKQTNTGNVRNYSFGSPTQHNQCRCYFCEQPLIHCQLLVQTAEDEEEKERVVILESFSSFKRRHRHKECHSAVFLLQIQCFKCAKGGKTKPAPQSSIIKRPFSGLAFSCSLSFSPLSVL